MLKNPSKAGYTFTGWVLTESDAPANQTITIALGSTGDKEYTAKWTAIEYKLTYDLDGGILGEEETNPEEYTIETDDFTLNNPTKVGYTFAGWFSNAELTGVAVTAISATDIGDKAFFAKWTANKYTVTFVMGANGTIVGKPEHLTQTVTYGASSVAVTAKAKTGYEFIGWCNNSTADLFASFVVTKDTTITATFDKMSALEVVDSPTYQVTQMVISPNPVSRSAGSVTIYFPQNIVGTGTCTIYDAQGNRIDHQEVNLTRGTAIKWDLCNEGGRRVASGGYLAILQVTDSMGMVHFAKAMVGVKQ